MSRARVLILNGSPLPDGHSMALARAVLAPLAVDCDTVHLYRENITPCLACGACAGGNPCPIADSVPALLSRIAAADFLIVASPLHFTSLTAPVIALFSRMQPYWQAAKAGKTLLPPRRRVAGLAVTAGSEYANMFRPARSVAAAALNSLNIPFAGMATAANTDTVSVGENATALAEAEELGERMAAAIHCSTAGKNAGKRGHDFNNHYELKLTPRPASAKHTPANPPGDRRDQARRGGHE